MAVAVMYEFRSMNQEIYDRFIRERYQGQSMPGVISHAAGPLEGGWWAFDVYESEEARRKIEPPAIEQLRAMGLKSRQPCEYYRCTTCRRSDRNLP